MPIQSKYSNQDVEQLMEQLQQVFTQAQAPTDLQLMVLGNLVSQVLTERVGKESREALAAQFGAILQQAVRNH